MEHSNRRQDLPKPILKRQPATVQDYVFTFEISTGSMCEMPGWSDCEPLFSWTGTLTDFDLGGGPYCNMWTAETQPRFAFHLAALLDRDVDAEHFAERLRRFYEVKHHLRMRAFVSKATASGPRTIKLYDGGLLKVAAPTLEDWMEFHQHPLPLHADVVDCTGISFPSRTNDAIVQARDDGSSVDGPWAGPYVHLREGHLDELMGLGGFTFMAKEVATYLERLAPW